jgi:hypothetical protein
MQDSGAYLLPATCGLWACGLWACGLWACGLWSVVISYKLQKRIANCSKLEDGRRKTGREREARGERPGPAKKKNLLHPRSIDTHLRIDTGFFGGFVFSACVFGRFLGII